MLPHLILLTRKCALITRTMAFIMSNKSRSWGWGGAWHTVKNKSGKSGSENA